MFLGKKIIHDRQKLTFFRHSRNFFKEGPLKGLKDRKRQSILDKSYQLTNKTKTLYANILKYYSSDQKHDTKTPPSVRYD